MIVDWSIKKQVMWQISLWEFDIWWRSLRKSSSHRMLLISLMAFLYPFLLSPGERVPSKQGQKP